MGRLIVIVLIAVLVVWQLRRALAAQDRTDAPPQAPGGPQGDLVNCAHCGVNLPKSEARSAGGRHYCSEEHWRAGPRDG
ncbi:MAG TPA: PP0621 family protein [Burkholderiales bacterium]|nr:PP0621 family protein [Burkholderiales bacterium]